MSIAVMESIDWWHSITFPDGSKSSGKYDTEFGLKRIHMPDDLSGKTVLDIGCWDGYYSFEGEKRGAEVTAIDTWAYSRDGMAGFEYAKSALKSNVKSMIFDAMDLSEDFGKFDVVLYLGMLYHMKNPLLALEKVRSVTKDLLIIETHVAAIPVKEPAAIFYPNDELHGDSSNWWGFNIPGIESMLRSAGFHSIELKTLWGDRAVFHARVECQQ